MRAFKSELPAWIIDDLETGTESTADARLEIPEWREPPGFEMPEDREPAAAVPTGVVIVIPV